MAILVTGGAGYIGSVTVEQLKAKGGGIVVLEGSAGDQMLVSSAGGASHFPTENLLLRCLSFDLFNHDGLRTASLVDLATSGYLVSSKRQKFRVLPTRWRGIGDRPVNSSVVRENDEL